MVFQQTDKGGKNVRTVWSLGHNIWTGCPIWEIFSTEYLASTTWHLYSIEYLKVVVIANFKWL